ncbi:MAG: hypothetical protein NC483_00230 [Ruminococcus sp.]|nr:hypothetical protein [Ruminococcus sp.]
MKKSKKELIIIDAYADKSVLDMITNIKVSILLIVKNNTLLKKLDIVKYQEQYNNLEIIYNDTFHDRFIILDNKDVYHLGTSLNKVGNRTFAINKLSDSDIIKALLSKIKSLSKIDKDEYS